MSNETPRRVPVYFPRRQFLRGAAMLAGSAAAGLSMPLGSLVAMDVVDDASGAVVADVTAQADEAASLAAPAGEADTLDGDINSRP